MRRSVKPSPELSHLLFGMLTFLLTRAPKEGMGPSLTNDIFKLRTTEIWKSERLTEIKLGSNTSKKEDELKEITKSIYNIEEKEDEGTAYVKIILKKLLERMIEKKLEYYL